MERILICKVLYHAYSNFVQYIETIGQETYMSSPRLLCLLAAAS